MSVFFFQGLTTIVFILVAVRIILDLVDEQYVNSAYGISSMLAKGFSALIFQIIGGRVLDIFPGNNGYIHYVSNFCFFNYNCFDLMF